MSGQAHAAIRQPGETPVFMLQTAIPLDKDFLRAVQRAAVNNPMALPLWATQFEWRTSEEAVYFTEKEWDVNTPVAPHRVDLYTIMRGMTKTFDPKYDVSIAMRQMVLRSLFEQQAQRSILTFHPQSISQVIQLALFDQVVY